jgi:hypothetical protein
LLDPRNPSSYKPALADGHCGNAEPAAEEALLSSVHTNPKRFLGAYGILNLRVAPSA